MLARHDQRGARQSHPANSERLVDQPEDRRQLGHPGSPEDCRRAPGGEQDCGIASARVVQQELDGGRGIVDQSQRLLLVSETAFVEISRHAKARHYTGFQPGGYICQLSSTIEDIEELNKKVGALHLALNHCAAAVGQFLMLKIDRELIDRVAERRARREEQVKIRIVLWTSKNREYGSSYTRI